MSMEMDSSALDAILSDSSTPDDTSVDTGDYGAPQDKAPVADDVVDPDLAWDEDDNNDPEPEDKAPDQQDDDELAKIEEKNKWMKGRLAPVKDKLTRAEQELAALRAENESLKTGRPAQKAPEAQAQDLEQFIESQPSVVALTEQLKALDAKADELTEKQYIDAKMELLSELKMEKRDIVNSVRQHFAQQHQQVAASEEKIFADYTAAVLAKKEEYPDIDKALDRLNKNAGNLDLEIRRSLIFEGNDISPMAAELVNIVGNDKKAMSYLIAQTKLAKQTGRMPVQAIEYIGRLKAKIQSEVGSNAPDVDDTYRAARQRKPGVPKDVRSHAAAETTDLQAWAQAALKKGQRPW